MRVLISGGGTGGHVYPALAVIDELRRTDPDARVCYVGTRRGLEARLLSDRQDVDFRPISARGLPRERPLQVVGALSWLALSMLQTLWIFLRFRPHVVLGVGGHSSFPPVLLGALLGRFLPIRTMIHEQNVMGGLANRVLSRFVDVVMLSFDESRRSFPRARRIAVTGNPIREELLHATRCDEAYALFGLDPRRRTILVFGGSKGSEEITEQIRAGRSDIADHPELQLLLITGDEGRTRQLRAEMLAGGVRNVAVFTYVERMGEAFAIADLVVCRAGATSLAEITACGKASLLVPWPGAADDHQRANAIAFRDEGACTVAEEDALCRGGLVRLMQELAGDDAQLGRLARNARRSGRRDAGQAILDELRTLVGEVGG